MKTRIISALVGLPLVLVVLYYSGYGVVLNLFIALVSGIAAFEGMRAAGALDCKPITVAAIISATFVPFIREIKGLDRYLGLIFFVYILFMFSVILFDHMKYKLEYVLYAVLFGIIVPLSFSCIVFVRKGVADGALYMLIIFIVSWFSDIGAYFAGSMLGRHKLSPVISPKKTVEGAIGGYLLSLVAVIVTACIYCSVYSTGNIHLNYATIIVYSLIGSTLSIFGDLSTSILKRQKDIKNYGKIMPGHGGVLDRFDSMLFVAPFTYFISQFIHIIVK